MEIIKFIISIIGFFYLLKYIELKNSFNEILNFIFSYYSFLFVQTCFYIKKL